MGLTVSLGLQDAGFALLEAAAARNAAADTSTKNAVVFQPSSFDRYLTPEGQKYTPDLLSRYLREGAIGRTPDLFGFYTEMRSRDPHLDGEIQDQVDMITSAKLDALPFPSFPQPVKGGRMTPEAVMAEDVSSFLWDRYSSPDFSRSESFTALCEGEWCGVGGYETEVEINPAPGIRERVKKNTPLPSQRFWTEQVGTRLMFQPTGLWLPLVPVDDLGPNGTAQLVVHQVETSVPNPARRGVLRRCLNYWLIKQRGIVWWAQYVQNFGSPALMGFFDSATDGARAILEKAFTDLGNGSKMVLPKGTDVKPLEIAMRLAGETPHQQIADWSDRQVSRVVSGHDQSSAIQRTTGSRQSSETSQDKAQRRAQTRASRIAQTLREWDAKPAVAREFGPDVADKFTSVLALHVDRPKDLLSLAQAFEAFGAAGVTTIPVQEFHSLTGIRTAEEGEACITPPARTAPPGAFGQTGDPNAADPKSALARILPFAREAVRAAVEEGGAAEADVTALKNRLLKKAAKRAVGAGEEVVAPYRDIIVKAAAEGATLQQIVVRVLHRATAQLEAPELEDLLASTIAEAMLAGVVLERKAAGK
jgi:phage gp29-like protein